MAIAMKFIKPLSNQTKLEQEFKGELVRHRRIIAGGEKQFQGQPLEWQPSYMELKCHVKELQEANTALRKRIEQLCESDTRKKRLFSIISHDLKGSMNTLSGISQLLTEYSTRYDQKTIQQGLTHIHSMTGYLSNYLSELLQWGKIQMDQSGYHPIKIELKGLVTNTLKPLSEKATWKQIPLHNLIKEECLVYVDPNMIRSVLQNLISNGIKFTPVGGEINIQAIARKYYIEISITDTGIGISEADLSKLFKIDILHTTPGTDNEKGTGFGLILCREILGLHQGFIKVTSKLDQGTCVTFTLPKTAHHLRKMDGGNFQ